MCFLSFKLKELFKKLRLRLGMVSRIVAQVEGSKQWLHFYIIGSRKFCQVVNVRKLTWFDLLTYYSFGGILFSTMSCQFNILLSLLAVSK